MSRRSSTGSSGKRPKAARSEAKPSEGRAAGRRPAQAEGRRASSRGVPSPKAARSEAKPSEGRAAGRRPAQAEGRRASSRGVPGPKAARSEAKPSEGRAAGRRPAQAEGRRASSRGVPGPKAARRGKRSAERAAAPTGGRLLHLDAFSGVAGNMFVGALLDLGLSQRALESDLAGLGVPHRLRVRRVRRGPLAARYVSVEAPGARSHAGGHDHPRRGGHGRSFAEIARLLRRARLATAVRERALAIFEALGRAESRVHGVPLDAVHFHEVGAVDAIVDITAAAIGLERLGVTRVTCSPLALGHGQIDTDHGRLPLPAPATLELLRGVPTCPAHVAWETVTPTGAAIVRTVVEAFRPMPAMRVAGIGHGAGDDRPGPMPNVLRAVLGEDGPGWDRVLVLETHLDDLVPEHFDWLMERLFEAGALDVSLQHLQMKKNRPGFLVRVLARPSLRSELAEILFTESTALGVRATEWDRLVLPRAIERVETPFGRIAVKLARGAGGRIEASAEYEDCKRAARRAGVSLREVVRAAETAARDAHVNGAPRLTTPRRAT
jgi:uncharacterized protein (TIGR00299 family) protein